MRYIFVGGSQRSGTTLLNKILCSGQETNARLKECAYLQQIVKAYFSTLINNPDEVLDYFGSPQAFRDFQRKQIQAYLDTISQKFPQASALVLKEPHLTRLFPVLYDLVPNSFFVLIIRDPRDTIASMFKVKARMLTSGRKHSYIRFETTDFIKEYIQFYLPILKDPRPSFAQRCPFIRYEDLVHQPETAVEQLRQLTGLKLANFRADQALLSENDTEKKSDLSQHRNVWQTELSGQVISAQNVNQYAQILSPAAIQEIESHPQIQELMTKFNYSPSTHVG